MTLDELQRLRLRRHRLHPSRPLRDARAAAAFVRARGLVMETGRSSLPILAEAIAGYSIRGSWMADRQVYRIHRILSRVRRHGILSVPLILGKATLLPASLGPSVERIAGDRERARRVRAELPPLAHRLLDAVEGDGQIRMDRWARALEEGRKARLLLERELLVVGRSLHTEGGYHTSLVIPWRAGAFSRRFRRAAGRMRLEEAERMLLLTGLRSAVVAPESEVRRWFVAGARALPALLAEDAVRRYGSGRRAWLAAV